ncbi:MAG TPA: DUF481 domain-containing protein [Xanthomonadaceae bacterium]|nr:DUF481 domain-containing protein [Xanthomonadaceae bacterium]
MSLLRFAPLLFVLAAPLPAVAQFHAGLAPRDGAAAEGWKGRGELGFAMARGNTDSQTFIGKLDFGYSDARSKYAFGASTQYGKNAGEESARRYEVRGAAGFRFDERSYLFGSLRHERDAFASYEYQWTAAAGYGVDALRGEDQQLSLEVGPGYRLAKDQGLRVHHDEAIARGLLDWNWKLTGTTSLMNTLLVESGGETTFARNVLGVRVAVSESLAMKAGLETRYNSRVDDGQHNTDNLTTLNLVYDFK